MKILYEGTEWEMLEFKSRFHEWTIYKMSDSTCIECSGKDNATLVLDQDELKILIAFLQRQIK